MTQALLIMPSVLAVDDAFVVSLPRLPDLSVHATSDPLTFFYGISQSDVVLIHHQLANNAARTLVQWIRQLNLDLPIVVVGLPDDQSEIVAYYEAGAASYLLTSDPPDVMASTIHDSLSGVSRLDGHVTGALIQRLALLRRQVTDDMADSEDPPTPVYLDIAAGM